MPMLRPRRLRAPCVRSSPPCSPSWCSSSCNRDLLGVGVIAGADKQNAIFAVAAFVGGFSERWGPHSWIELKTTLLCHGGPVVETRGKLRACRQSAPILRRSEYFPR